MSDPLNGKKIPVILAILAVVVFGLYRLWDVTPITIESGHLARTNESCDSGSNVPVIGPGEKFQICLTGVYWHKIDATTGSMWLYDCKGNRVDLSKSDPLALRTIPFPVGIGLLEGTGKKARVEVMPNVGLPPCNQPSALGGSLTSTDNFLGVFSHTITYSYPKMPFVAK